MTDTTTANQTTPETPTILYKLVGDVRHYYIGVKDNGKIQVSKNRDLAVKFYNKMYMKRVCDMFPSVVLWVETI